MKTALLIIDVQNVMFHYNVYKGKEILENIKLLINKARRAKIPIFYTQHTDNSREDLREGSALWHIHPEIQPRFGDIVLKKTNPDAFHKTNLHKKLNEFGIEKLVICGMQTEICVDTTCRVAFSYGYKNILVRNAHTTFDSKFLNASTMIHYHNELMKDRFASLKTAYEIDFSI